MAKVNFVIKVAVLAEGMDGVVSFVGSAVKIDVKNYVRTYVFSLSVVDDNIRLLQKYVNDILLT